jgi:hypothetical protein
MMMEKRATRPEELLSFAEAGRRLGVNSGAVRALVRMDKLEAVRTTPTARPRVTGRSVLALPDLLSELERPRGARLEEWKSGQVLKDNGWVRDAAGALVAP